MDGCLDRWSSRVGRDRGLRLAGVMLLGLATASMSARPASASAIQASGVVVNSIDSLGPAWAQFLAGGTALWAIEASPPIPSGLILPTENGKLVETAFVDYLYWRRSLDPSRFDAFHPVVGHELGQLPAPQFTGAPGSSSTGGSTPAQPQTTNTPEPGSFLITLVLLGTALGWGRHSRQSCCPKSAASA